ncbi:uncharacterized protein [Ptychodera flava]|uniref:uncharacterized protein n=1 Tax=Ptychodera flava TaxID=63121 RepID=UPI00396A6800
MEDSTPDRNFHCTNDSSVHDVQDVEVNIEESSSQTIRNDDTTLEILEEVNESNLNGDSSQSPAENAVETNDTTNTNPSCETPEWYERCAHEEGNITLCFLLLCPRFGMLLIIICLCVFVIVIANDVRYLAYILGIVLVTSPYFLFVLPCPTPKNMAGVNRNANQTDLTMDVQNLEAGPENEQDLPPSYDNCVTFLNPAFEADNISNVTPPPTYEEYISYREGALQNDVRSS